MTNSDYIGIKNENIISISLLESSLDLNNLINILKNEIEKTIRLIYSDFTSEAKLIISKKEKDKVFYNIESEGIILGKVAIYMNEFYKKSLYNRDGTFWKFVDYRWFNIYLTINDFKFLKKKGWILPNFRNKLAQQFKTMFKYKGDIKIK